jgi:DNA-binding IclR family transcriptional regulator
MIKLLKLIHLLANSKISPTEAAVLLKMDKRSTYRYYNILEEMKIIKVTGKSGARRYSVDFISGCPCCGKEVNHG